MSGELKDKKPTKVMIGTPTAGGVVNSQFASTLASTVRDLKERGIDVWYMSFDSADVELARNYLATLFLEDETCTHLFFVDSDMSFSGGLCHHLLSMGRDVVGVACPRRGIDMDRLAERLSSGSADINEALAFSMTYNVNLGTKLLNVRNGLCEVEGIGAGVMLIRKNVFETMLIKGAAVRRDSYDPDVFSDLKGGLGDFFERIRRDSRLISEDFSFCLKWREKCGGKVWTAVDQDVGHVGDIRFGVPYHFRLKQGLS